MVDETLDALCERLAELGLTVEAREPIKNIHPGTATSVTLTRGATSQRYRLLLAPSMTLRDVASLTECLGGGDSPVLVIGERIDPRSARALSHAGLQYLDSAGNANICFADVIISIQGRSPRLPQRTRHVGQRTRSVDLFSPKRAQVIFALLSWPDLAARSMRTIADAAGVSLGLTQSTLSLLESTGYLLEFGGRRPQRRDELVDQWVAAYRWGLAPTLKLRDFAGDPGQLRSAPGAQLPLTSGESAVPDLLRPATLTLYVHELTPSLVAANRWRTDGPPTVFVRRQFWRDPTSPARERTDESSQTVPPLLLYADLLASDDPRQRRAAQDFRSSHAELLAVH